MSYLAARFFRPALRTLQPKTFSLTLQKRSRQYDLPTDRSGRFFPKFASAFGNPHLDALQVSFEPADKYDVIPKVQVTIAENRQKYFLPNIDIKTFIDDEFNVENLKLVDDRVRTFVDKLHDVSENSGLDAGTSESLTDTLVIDLLLHVVNFDEWPFKVRLEPPLSLITYDGTVSAEPEFVVNKKKIALIGVEDRHLKNQGIYPLNGFGECQMAAEILACGYENIIDNIDDQEIFAFRIISTYVTFYKAEIPVSYWEGLRLGLPKKPVVIKRWPKDNGRKTGLNLLDPEGRRAVITDLFKIRQHLLG